LISEQYVDGSTFNYFTGGNLEALLNTNLNGVVLGNLGVK